MQVRNFYQLVAHSHVVSPHMLVGNTLAVFQKTEMHVFLMQAMTVLSLTYREVRRLRALGCSERDVPCMFSSATPPGDSQCRR